ncbi:hypothetical protein CARUB_v10016137mg [Capsella rubella]|uniref:Leucine-rich repeat-containing N-terminal plant-type domain-containing protein n=1 Tax=Capsella rubella TaxID=81985 RepID=R0GB64_9BRAS|nr:hypothetical protein CARUB_v10016137mg [Capsella rubella]
MNSSFFAIFISAAIIFLGCLTLTGAATCHSDDEAALLAFKAGITRDPLGILSSWNKGTNCCSWMGVICTTGNRVTKLRIFGGGGGSLWGNISPSLARLQYLEDVSFTYLKTTGSFPRFLFQLPKLHVIRISHTHLSGPLPANIGALSHVEDVALDNNRFHCSISNLTQLTWLDLAGNRLTCTIPDVFKSMTRLCGLDLSNNRFFGKLPMSIASLAPTVTFLDLSKNNLSGTIPNYLSKFGELSTLDLSRNRFSGAVPFNFAYMTSIYHLKLSHNLLNGSFPTMKFVDGIGSLDLSYNQYHLEMIPEWITSSPAIYSLKLAKCGIKMRFDDWKPVRTESIKYLDFSENEILGSPTSFLNQATNLLEFKMSGNKLRFSLGEVKFTKSLRILDLSRNLLYGKVHASVAGLQQLNLSQNHLCGKLPSTNFSASVFGGNDCLCGSPLSSCKA